MRLHRFFYPFEEGDGQFAVEDERLAHQWRHVLRLGEGSHVLLFNGKGDEVEAEMSQVDKKSVQVRVIEHKKWREEGRRIRLYCSILKRENFDLVVQKATEVGVAEIIPVLTARTVKKDVRLDRLQKIAIEAAEQSGRAMIPVVHDPMTLPEALELSLAEGATFFCDMDGQTDLSKEGDVGIFIGPEGGWSEEDRKIFEKKGIPAFGLGDFTLRAETAAIIAAWHVNQL